MGVLWLLMFTACSWGGRCSALGSVQGLDNDDSDDLSSDDDDAALDGEEGGAPALCSGSVLLAVCSQHVRTWFLAVSPFRYITADVGPL